MVEAARSLPRVVHDTFEVSKTREKTCPDCWDQGTIYRRRKDTTCATCDGNGKVLVVGSVANRKPAFEVASLIKQAPMIEQNFNYMEGSGLAAGSGRPFENVIKNVSRILREGGRVTATRQIGATLALMNFSLDRWFSRIS